MSRSTVAIVVLSCLLALSVGYIVLHLSPIGTGMAGYDTVAYPPPETVKLPFKKTFGKGEFSLEIEAVPGRPNEVKIKAHASAGHTYEKREWIQHGPGNVIHAFFLEGGKDRYFLDIGELKSEGQEVTSVRVSLQCKYLSGARE